MAIVKGVLSTDHVHMFVSIPRQLAVSDFMRRVKGPSSRKIQQVFPAIRKRYWGRHFWARGNFCTTSGNIADDVILQDIENHAAEPIAVDSGSVSWAACGVVDVESCRWKRGGRATPTALHTGPVSVTA